MSYLRRTKVVYLGYGWSRVYWQPSRGWADEEDVDVVVLDVFSGKRENLS